MPTVLSYDTPYQEVIYTPEADTCVISNEWDMILINTPFVYIIESKSGEMFKQFNLLKEKWLAETMFCSTPDDLYGNKHYQAIIDMGFPVVPYLLEDLKTNNVDWIFALRKIIGSHPIREENYGIFNAMKNDWLTWAKSNLGIPYGA